MKQESLGDYRSDKTDETGLEKEKQELVEDYHKKLNKIRELEEEVEKIRKRITEIEGYMSDKDNVNRFHYPNINPEENETE